MPEKVELTLMGMDGPRSDLVRRACTDAVGNIELEPLDKGLSGARVLLARWPLRAGMVSAPHVLKLGELSKLKWEAESTERLISPVDPQVGHIRLFEDAANGVGLLRQAFLGSRDGDVVSLKTWVRGATDSKLVAQKIEELYGDRMRYWHYSGAGSVPMIKSSFAETFQGRVSRQPALVEAYNDVGQEALEASFADKGFASIQAINDAVASLNDRSEDFPEGLAHGDLHAQNILLSDGQLQLIDFAWARYSWKALDFLMLECSLKFLVMPDECRIEDLVYLEASIESGARADCGWSELKTRPYSRYLRNLAAAVCAVREQAARLKAVNDFEQYRRGSSSSRPASGPTPA